MLLFEQATARGLFRPLLNAVDCGFALGPLLFWTLVGVGSTADQLMYTAGALQMAEGLMAYYAAPRAMESEALQLAASTRRRRSDWGKVVRQVEACCYR